MSSSPQETTEEILQEKPLTHENLAEIPESAGPEKGTIADAEYITRIEETIDTENVDVEGMGERAEAYAQMMEEKKGLPKKTPVNPPVVPTAKEEESPGPEQKQPRFMAATASAASRGARGGAGARGGSRARTSARLALATAGSFSDPPVKPHDAKDKGKEKEEKTPTKTGRRDKVAQPSSDEYERIESASTPTLGDEGFPAAEVPGLSDDYHALSVLSSHHEGMSAELADITTQMRRLLETVGEQNVKIAKLQSEVTEVKQDKSSFMSDFMDRLRAIERKMPEAPSIAAPASAVVSIAEDKQEPVIAGETVSLADMMKQYKAKKRH